MPAFTLRSFTEPVLSKVELPAEVKVLILPLLAIVDKVPLLMKVLIVLSWLLVNTPVMLPVLAFIKVVIVPSLVIEPEIVPSFSTFCKNPSFLRVPIVLSVLLVNFPVILPVAVLVKRLIVSLFVRLPVIVPLFSTFCKNPLFVKVPIVLSALLVNFNEMLP